MNTSFLYKIKNGFIICILVLLLQPLLFSGCKKYLDEKPIKAQVVPSTLSDLQVLLDNTIIINQDGPALLELVCDDYFISDNTYNGYSSGSGQSQIQHYIWDSQAIPSDLGWNNSYQRPIYTGNVVLDQLPKIGLKNGEASTFNTIKGSALFVRAFSLEELAQLYCKPYDASTANTDLGLVLRTTSDINTPSVRASVQATYDLILSDLKEAATLLPITSLFPTRPTKVAAFGALARTYLSMRQYDSAGHYADLALGFYNTLIDYNSRVPVSSPPMITFNAEVVFHNVMSGGYFLNDYESYIDTVLYQLYDANDLRKDVFFKVNGTTGSGQTTYGFQGSYHGNEWTPYPFDGITTGELYLIRAESYAKSGNTVAAMNDFNSLMEKRWKNTSWIPFTASDASNALQQIRTERRKELVRRGQRWSDLRRYNLEDSSITLKRVIHGTTYTLPPNDKRWVMLIPWEVINRSGIEQNPR